VPPQKRAFYAAFFGWMLDGFDFTILTFVLADIQRSFTVDNALAGALGTVTLMFRLVGGAAAGTAADRWGRKLPLVLSIVWFSLFTLLSGFSTSAMLFACRALFGIIMGGEWRRACHWPRTPADRLRRTRRAHPGVGLKLAWPWYIRHLPRLHKGTAEPWRPMLWLGAVPALFVLWIRSRVRSPIGSSSDGTGRNQSLLTRIFGRDLLPPPFCSLPRAFMVSYYSVTYWYATFLQRRGLFTLHISLR
jgi:MFS family permease